MANLEADTHGMVVTGAGPTVINTELTIGSITLPAGGPWKIFQLWCQVARATPLAAEATGGFFSIDAPQGDLEPNPSPAQYPAGFTPAFLGASEPMSLLELNLIDVAFSAPGKATIDFSYQTEDTQSVAPQIAMGVIFGKTRPMLKPFTKVGRSRATVTNVAADTAIGTLTLAESAKLIHAVCCMVAPIGVIVTLEEIVGFFRLSSDDVKLPPAQFPISNCYGAGLGVVISGVPHARPIWIPVNIPVEGGARIDSFIDLNSAVTNALEVNVFIAYE